MSIGPLAPVAGADYQTAGVASGTVLVISKPTGVVSGDVLFAFVSDNSSGSTTPPAGWTLVWGYTLGRAGGLYRKVIPNAANESATTYTFTFGGLGRLTGMVWRLSGVDNTTPVDVVPGVETAGASGTVTLPSVTSVTAGALLLVLVFSHPGSNNTDATYTFPASSPQVMKATVAVATASTVNAIGYELRPVVGATGTRVVSGVGTPVGGNATPTGNLVLIRPGATPPMGSIVKLGDGSAAGLSYLDGSSTRVAPTSIGIIRPGFAMVTAMRAKLGATWAHRGGSSDYPEMSEYAYDQAVLRGYGVLEFSANRTSDGQWVGVHDFTLERTSQNPALTTPISAMTLAQVQAQMNTLHSNGIPRPYWKLTDFLQKWGQTHVIICDPKGGLNFNNEFLALIDGIVAPSRLIWKYTGIGNTAQAAAAKARGWQTWGYFYDTDVDSGDFATYASNPAWDLIGMNIGAAQSYWDTALAVGKPVVGHIATSQAMYDSAIAKGAVLVQCGNVAGIAPVSSWS